MEIKYLGDRVSYSENKERLLIVISGKISNNQIVMILIWFVLWSLCGIGVLTQVFGDYTNELKLTLTIYMIFWVYFEFKIGYALLWRVWGAELIKIDKESISIKRDIKGYGKVNKYFIDNINDLKIIEEPNNLFVKTINNSFWSIAEKTISFNYMNKTVAFAIQLTNDESKKLISKIKSEIRKKA